MLLLSTQTLYLTRRGVLSSDCGARRRWHRRRSGFHRVHAVAGWGTVKSGEGEEGGASAAAAVACFHEESGHQLGKRGDARGEEVCPNSEEESSGLDGRSPQAFSMVEDSRLCMEILHSFGMMIVGLHSCENNFIQKVDV